MDSVKTANPRAARSNQVRLRSPLLRCQPWARTSRKVWSQRRATRLIGATIPASAPADPALSRTVFPQCSCGEIRRAQTLIQAAFPELGVIQCVAWQLPIWYRFKPNRYQSRGHFSGVGSVSDFREFGVCGGLNFPLPAPATFGMYRVLPRQFAVAYAGLGAEPLIKFALLKKV